MRIIAGKARGRRLESPRGSGVRPTRDAVREALFSILGPLDEVVVLDGFAGTGALGLEALSRGAERAYFFEPSGEAREVLKENIRRVGVAEQARLIAAPFERALSKITEEIDLFFLDPPYQTSLGRKALAAILATKGVYHDDSLVVLEKSAQEEISYEGWELEEERVYGTTALLFLRPQNGLVKESKV